MKALIFVKETIMANNVRKLHRNRRNRVVAGVCSGVADYSGLDLTLVRLVFIALAFFNGIGFFLYLLMMIIVPKQSQSHESSDSEYIVHGKDAISPSSTKASFDSGESLPDAQYPQPSHTGPTATGNANAFDGEALAYSEDSPGMVSSRTYWIGLTLVALGMYFFVVPFLPTLRFEYLFAFALIGVGIYLTIKK